MDKLLILLRYIFINAFFLACIIGAIFYNIQWAKNIAIFYAVVCGVLASIIFIFILMSPPGTIKSLKESKIPVPVWFDMTYDIICITIMASAGWFFISGFYFFHTIALAATRNRIKELKTKNA
jgi:xanthine/uracil permease